MMPSKISEGRYSPKASHGDSDVHDLYLHTRRSFKICLDKLPELWGDTTKEQDLLSIFLLHNKQSFQFLSIDVSISEDGDSSLTLHANEKVGCAPMFSPKTGKVCATIHVLGNMGEDLSEILPLIDGNLDIEFSPSLKLLRKSSIRPPVYFECEKYVDQYIIARKLHWRKFITEMRIEDNPSSATDWTRYASQSYDPKQALKYPNKKNLLSESHLEWKGLNYILKMSFDEICSATTPKISRQAYQTKINDLRRQLNLRDIIRPTELRIHSSDPLEIKKLKETGNRILHSITSDYMAWSVDFSTIFERYVQYVFDKLAQRIGAHAYFNSHFAISGAHTAWTLSYLEPDILLRRGDKVWVADAKYKMHMYNMRSESTDALKDAFRHDLHQVLAYSSFEKDNDKKAFIIYPCNSFSYIQQRIRSTVLSVTNVVYLVGIPWGECQYTTDGPHLPIEKKVKQAIDGLINIMTK